MMLPTPTAEAQIQSNRLIDIIKQKINISNGAIPFSEYMNTCLFYPQTGYYSGLAPKFGISGDFVTAPEISSLFGASIVPSCLKVFNEIGTANILEFGAGSGKLALDILTTLEVSNISLNCYYIVEVSPTLIKAQKNLILQHNPKFLEKIKWLDSLENFRFDGVIIANEVLDSLPIDLLLVKNKKIYEQCVTYQANQFTMKLLPVRNELGNTEFITKKNYEENYNFELHSLHTPWIATLSKILNRGGILIFDYGFPEHEYYHPTRTMGTLMCHYRHICHHDYFLHPGLQDITAHVNFTEIYEAAVNNNLDLLGYTHQAGYLLENNILSKLKTHQDHIAINLLSSPAEMGEIVKVIALGKGINTTIPGFINYDKRHTL